MSYESFEAHDAASFDTITNMYWPLTAFGVKASYPSFDVARMLTPIMLERYAGCDDERMLVLRLRRGRRDRASGGGPARLERGARARALQSGQPQHRQTHPRTAHGSGRRRRRLA